MAQTNPKVTQIAINNDVGLMTNIALTMLCSKVEVIEDPSVNNGAQQGLQGYYIDNQPPQPPIPIQLGGAAPPHSGLATAFQFGANRWRALDGVAVEMKFPWVSRGRFEDLEKRLAQVMAERDRFLDSLLSGPKDVPTPVLTTAQRPRPVKTADQPSNVIAFSTPFDALESRFSKAHSAGKVPSQSYRAKA